MEKVQRWKISKTKRQGFFYRKRLIQLVTDFVDLWFDCFSVFCGNCCDSFKSLCKFDSICFHQFRRLILKRNLLIGKCLLFLHGERATVTSSTNLCLFRVFLDEDRELLRNAASNFGTRHRQLVLEKNEPIWKRLFCKWRTDYCTITSSTNPCFFSLFLGKCFNFFSELGNVASNFVTRHLRLDLKQIKQFESAFCSWRTHHNTSTSWTNLSMRLHAALWPQSIVPKFVVHLLQLKVHLHFQIPSLISGNLFQPINPVMIQICLRFALSFLKQKKLLTQNFAKSLFREQLNEKIFQTNQRHVIWIRVALKKKTNEFFPNDLRKIWRKVVQSAGRGDKLTELPWSSSMSISLVWNINWSIKTPNDSCFPLEIKLHWQFTFSSFMMTLASVWNGIESIKTQEMSIFESRSIFKSRSPFSRVLGCLARRQQHFHHHSGQSEMAMNRLKHMKCRFMNQYQFSESFTSFSCCWLSRSLTTTLSSSLRTVWNGNLSNVAREMWCWIEIAIASWIVTWSSILDPSSVFIFCEQTEQRIWSRVFEQCRSILLKLENLAFFGGAIWLLGGNSCKRRISSLNTPKHLFLDNDIFCKSEINSPAKALDCLTFWELDFLMLIRQSRTMATYFELFSHFPSVKWIKLVCHNDFHALLKHKSIWNNALERE